MNRFVLLTTVAAFALTSGMASATTLTNTEKVTVRVLVQMKHQKHEITLKPGSSFDTGKNEAYFTLGQEKPFFSKGYKALLIKDDKIMVAPREAVSIPKTPAKTTLPPVASTSR